ncbi:MAG: hypothetical protein WCV67_06240 [Victivallaceae bacterium]|jgi:hypothetical protein
MPFILLSIIAVAAIVVAGMSAVHGPVIVTGPATIAQTAAVGGLPLTAWIIVFAVIGLCGWWLFRRRRS